MRVEFINRLGGKMLVDETRVEEYKVAGYKLATDSIEKEETPKVTPKRRIKKEDI